MSPQNAKLPTIPLLPDFNNTMLTQMQNADPSTIARRSCCLCDGNEFEIVATRDRQDEALVTVMCRHCGLISHRDIPSDEKLAEFYGSRYRWEYHGERRPGPRRVMRAWKNGQRITRQLVPHLEQGNRLLEIGAGIGCTVRSLREAGFHATGVDPGTDFTDFARNELGVDIRCQSIDQLESRPRYDGVLLVHVIEHLNAPHHGLMRIHRTLNDGGHLYIECPNLDAPVARQDRLFHFAHVYNFTPTTLRMMAERCGFEFIRQFGRKRHPNLQMLFRKSNERSFCVRPASPKRTLKRIRLNPLHYHLRPAYLAERVRKLGSYAIEHMFAESFTHRLVATSRPALEPKPAVIFPFEHPAKPEPALRRAA